MDTGLNTSKLIAGFSGGLLAAFVIREKEPFAVISSVLAGALTANFLSDAVAHYLPTWIGGGGISFITGLCAMAICQGIVATVKNWLRFTKATKE